MQKSDFRREIVQAWSLFDAELKIGRSLIRAESLGVEENVRRVALDPESSYLNIYRSTLSYSAYNFILNDYSIFQFSWSDVNEWRMSYLPNPWIAGAPGAQEIVSQWEILEEIGDLSHEDASDLINEIEYKAAIPPIRFEYSTRQYREVRHPAAHLYIGRHEENRWPCAILIGPYTFAMMIAKLYYPADWAPRSSFSGGTVEQCLDQEFARAMQAIPTPDEFSSFERKILHFGRHISATKTASTPKGRGGHGGRQGRR